MGLNDLNQYPLSKFKNAEIYILLDIKIFPISTPNKTKTGFDGYNDYELAPALKV